MKKLIAFAVGGLWTVSVLGEDLYECLGPDLVRSIVAPTTTNNDIPITSDIPQELADVILPAGVEWIGVVAGEMRMTAAFKTELPIAEAQTVLDAPLVAAGWTAVQAPTMLRSSPFVFGGSARMPGAQLCWNGRPGSTTVRDVDGTRYINLSWTGASGQGSCRATSSLGSGPPPIPMNDQMPRLQFPPGSSQPNGGGGSGGGSNRDYRTSTQFVSEDSPRELIDVLGRQLVEQGWAPDSTWSGRHGAGGTWSRQNDAGGRAVGSLEILSRADENYSVEFRLREF
jgi:hypothetical protein